MFLSSMASVKKTRDQSKEVHPGQSENTYHRHRENRYETLTSFQQKSQSVLRGNPEIATQAAAPPAVSETLGSGPSHMPAARALTTLGRGVL